MIFMKNAYSAYTCQHSTTQLPPTLTLYMPENVKILFPSRVSNASKAQMRTT